MAQSETLISFGSSWRWLPGTNEVSTPITAWRTNGFNDSGWLPAITPISYGANASGRDDTLTSGTVISNMINNYRCIFLRRTFVVTNVAEVQSVTFNAYYDDGFVAWINGVPVLQQNMPTNSPTYLTFASAAHEAEPAVLLLATNSPQNYLVPGTNLIAVQLFNNQIASSDLRFETTLEIAKLMPLSIATVAPAADSTVASLTQIAVTFTAPVIGVEAGDLLLNGLPAATITGNAPTNTYVFTFTQPPPGAVAVTWDELHGIVDLFGNPFDATAPGATWSYTLADTLAPQLGEIAPTPGVRVSRLTQVEVMFNELVQGVNASDLLINGQPATNLTGSGAGPYLFQFAQPAAGPIQFTWAAGHGITDLASVPNAFAGAIWTNTLDPVSGPLTVRLNELLTANVAANGLRDEFGNLQDWIELYNYGATVVDLNGCSLTDDPKLPGKWVFPPVTLAPNQYLVVFASGLDRKVLGGTNKLHTSFSLDTGGEYLGLFNAESPRLPLDEFTPAYPEQRMDYSFGRDTANALRYFSVPTPGAANGNSAIVGVVEPVHFTVGRGFFNQPFTMLLTTPTPGATIRYTTDGSPPTETTGSVYTGPLTIDRTTTLRAAAFQTGQLPTLVQTHTYLFVSNVLSQPANPPGFPTTGKWSDNTSAPDYEMDPEVVTSPLYSATIEGDLLSVPTLSIVMRTDDMFDPVTGIYPNYSSSIEAPCSMELLNPDGSQSVQLDAGIEIHGGGSRLRTIKHSFGIHFRGTYGYGKLQYQFFPDSPVESFDSLVLRADYNNHWSHSDPTQRARGGLVRDAFVKDTQAAMGDFTSHSRYVHLYINGLYWGLFNPCEDPDHNFAASYFGGDGEEYDAIRWGDAVTVNGNTIAYNAMLSLNNAGLSDPAQYSQIQQYLDVTQYADYLILQHYGANWDWGATKNWAAVRKRETGAQFKYIPWDNERTFEGVNDSVVNTSPNNLQGNLVLNAEYRLLFADRVHQHLFNDGVLTPNRIAQLWMARANQINGAMVAESARWGDAMSATLYTRDGHFLAEQNRLLTTYFPFRTEILVNQFRAKGYYPTIDAPEFNQHGGRVAPGFNLAISAPAGTIYFTTNGADPRVPLTGAVSSQAIVYSGTPVTLGSSTLVKSRVLSGNTWSALNEATFTVGELGLPLRFTEIMYNPVGGDAYEFLELQNLGAWPLDVGGFSFQGITFLVPEGTVLPAGATLLLANDANPAQFATRYPGAVVGGYFAGNLANGGERVALLDRELQTVIAVHCDDEGGWPITPDGGGFSLEVIDPRGDPNAPANWRASSVVNGSPGLPPVAPGLGSVVLNEIAADNAGSVTNGGVFPDWIELHNSAGSPTNIAGWSLTDDSNARQFVFPANTVIPADGYLVVWCDAATNAPGLHTGFALGKSGETVSLFNASTSRLDAVTFGLQLTNYTVGRVGADWQLTTPTPNAANVAASLAASSELAINEWLADPGVGGQDWLELFNRSVSAPVALRGLYLGTSNAVFQYAALSFIPPRGYAQLYAEEQAGADQLEFKLPAAGGVIVLADATGVELDRVNYDNQIPAVSEGRLPDGAASLTAFTGSASPGASNYLLTYAGPVLNEVLARNDRAAISPWGNGADFVELFNPGGAVSLAGMAIGESDNFSKAWKFPAGASIAGGGYWVIWCDGARPASTSAAGPHNTGFSLSGESGDVMLFNALGQPVDLVRYGPQLQDQSIGRNGGHWELLATPTPGSGNAAAAPLGSATALRLNEWMAAPLAGDDWFELYNTDPLPVDLGGLYLTDDPSLTGLTNSPLAPLSFLGGRQWVKLIADGNRSAGRDHANFSLDQFGETLRLYDANLGLIDAVDFGLQMDGTSQGRLPDGAPSLVDFPATPTPGAANYLPLASVVINEILTHTDAPLEDAVELFNPTASPVDLSGWYLSDSQSDLKRYLIPGGTVVPAGGFKVIYQNQFGPGDGEIDTPPLFTFNSAHGDEVHLSQTDGSDQLTGYRASVTFNAAANGISFGRYPTSVGVDFVALSQRTFGVDNPANLAQFRTGTGATNAYPLVGPVVLNEIMYHPPDYGTNTPDNEEFIELLNLSAATVPLYDPLHATNVWRLANAVSFDFPADTAIPAGGRLLVVPFNPATDVPALTAFQARYGSHAPLVGPYAGQLDNAGETVELWRPDTPQAPPHPDAGFVPQLLVERVSYADVSPWPTNADGGGASLQRLLAQNYGNDPVNWKAAPPSAGLVNVTAPVGSATLPGGGLVRLSFTVQPGLTYQVEYQNDLMNANWLALGSPIVPTTSPLIVDDNLANQPQRFYRLLLVP